MCSSQHQCRCRNFVGQKLASSPTPAGATFPAMYCCTTEVCRHLHRGKPVLQVLRTEWREQVSKSTWAVFTHATILRCLLLGLAYNLTTNGFLLSLSFSPFLSLTLTKTITDNMLSSGAGVVRHVILTTTTAWWHVKFKSS